MTVPDPAVLVDGRAIARSLMRSRVIVRRPGTPARDHSTGKMVPQLTTVYGGTEGDIARIRFSSSQPRTVDVEGQRAAEQGPTACFPIDGEDGEAASNIRLDDVIEVVANPDNPLIVGMLLRVAGVHDQTQSTQRRLPVEVVSYA